jgi:hypothetical protein
MYEELRIRAQTFEVLTGGDFAADHSDGYDDGSKPEGEELGITVLPLPPQMIDDLRVKLQVWGPLEPSEALPTTAPAVVAAVGSASTEGSPRNPTP